ncbi:MAG TPA: VOC family protein [Gemmatimonadales bacterium]|nr:VOC family protein [Gemmatimonadales bacterium]
MPTKKRPARRTAASRAGRAPQPARPTRAQPETLRLREVSPALTVNDVGKSLAFYQNVLGFTVKDRWEEGGVLRGAELVAGNVTLMISQDDFRKGRDRVKGVGHRLWCLTAQDVDALAGQVRARGWTIDEGPTSEWGTRFFTVTDPDGFRLSFAQER